MRLKWRGQERLLVTWLLLLTLGSYSWKMFKYAPGDISPAFNYYVRDILPRIAPVLMAYFCYLWINLRLIPRLQSPGRNVGPASSFFGRITLFIRRYPWPVLQAVVLFFLLGLLFSGATHAGFRAAVIFHNRPNELRAFLLAQVLCIGYIIYVALREEAIKHIEGAGDRQFYLVTIVNRITSFVFGLTLLAKIVYLIGFIDDLKVVGVFYSLIAGVYFIGMGNVYWIFPKYEKEKFFNLGLLFRLLLLIVVCTSPMYLFTLNNGERLPAPLALYWLGALFVVTPISWVVYQYRKDQILKMRGMEKELVQSKSSLAFLRAQINPHFLFNALNTLYGTALQEQADRTAEGIQKLGDMMRFMLHENNQEKILMSREIEYLDNYIDLQKLRTATSPAIVIEADIDGGHCRHSIAPMLLIPFVENAFKHGISLQERSWIKIMLRCDDRQIYFETRNSLHARPQGDPGKDTSGIGLNNVRERLQWLYPGRYDLEVNQTGTEFVVRLILRP